MLKLLDEHPSLPLVIVSDVDVAWLGDPLAYFQQRPNAEFFISTDCLSMRVRALRGALQANAGNVSSMNGHVKPLFLP